MASLTLSRYSEDKADHRLLANRLAALTQFPVAVPNYRLTDTSSHGEDHLRHPSHAEDILQFLTFLITWSGPPDFGNGLPPYNPREIYVIGHSCSAHMLASIFLDTSAVTPSLTPPRALSDAVHAIVMSEGIYDLDLLLASFPAYREFFVEDTFGPNESYSEYCVTAVPLRTTEPRMRWLIVHSKGDTLVDISQSEAMYSHLVQLHSATSVERVFRNTSELDGEHNAILRGEHYARIVGSFILGDHSQYGLNNGHR